MKLFGFILAFYTLLLAAVPCCIIDNCGEEKAELSKDHKGDKGDCGNCSPFFNCEGCSVASVVYEIPEFSFGAPVLRSVYSVYQTVELKETPLEFWQPPKLG